MHGRRYLWSPHSLRLPSGYQDSLLDSVLSGTCHECHGPLWHERVLKDHCQADGMFADRKGCVFGLKRKEWVTKLFFFPFFLCISAATFFAFFFSFCLFFWFLCLGFLLSLLTLALAQTDCHVSSPKKVALPILHTKTNKSRILCFSFSTLFSIRRMISTGTHFCIDIDVFRSTSRQTPRLTGSNKYKERSSKSRMSWYTTSVWPTCNCNHTYLNTTAHKHSSTHAPTTKKNEEAPHLSTSPFFVFVCQGYTA